MQDLLDKRLCVCRSIRLVKHSILHKFLLPANWLKALSCQQFPIDSLISARVLRSILSKECPSVEVKLLSFSLHDPKSHSVFSWTSSGCCYHLLLQFYFVLRTKNYFWLFFHFLHTKCLYRFSRFDADLVHHWIHNRKIRDWRISFRSILFVPDFLVIKFFYFGMN